MIGIRILIDADACPVKDEVYTVAFRRGVPVRVVSNSYLRVPAHPLVERGVVSDAFDAADDWIAGQGCGASASVACGSRPRGGRREGWGATRSRRGTTG